MFIFAIVFVLNRDMKEIFHPAAASNLIWSSPKRSEQDVMRSRETGMLIFGEASGLVLPPRNLRIKLADSILPEWSNYCQKDFAKLSPPSQHLPYLLIQRRTRNDHLSDLSERAHFATCWFVQLYPAPFIRRILGYWISQQRTQSGVPVGPH